MQLQFHFLLLTNVRIPVLLFMLLRLDLFKVPFIQVLSFLCSQPHFFLYSCYLAFFFFFSKYALKIPSSFRQKSFLKHKNFFREVICQKSMQEVKAPRLLFINGSCMSTCVEIFENYP